LPNTCIKESLNENDGKTSDIRIYDLKENKEEKIDL